MKDVDGTTRKGEVTIVVRDLMDLPTLLAPFSGRACFISEVVLLTSEPENSDGRIDLP